MMNKKIIKSIFLTSLVSASVLGGYSLLSKDVTLVVNGEERYLSTFKSNVEQLLESEDIKYDKNDIITQNLNSKLNDGMKIEVIDVTEDIIKESKNIPFDVTVIEDSTLKKGKTKIEKEGKSGENQLIYKVTYHNGKQVKKTFVEEVVASKPINKIVKKGTNAELLVASSRGDTSRNSSSRKHMYVEASAYTGHSITSTGTTPKWGTIAVDPSVIPYGTKVYIPKFNKTFIAEDCGGAIKGNKIDIYMNDESSAYNFGRQNIDIYILN